ncbi:hypothetical protein ACHAW5_005264 [Stephanodiscus triporus]|uniref:Uncharacterized protein n=1 Tax=Stephanodiscus triporus TaxID=2934178 RepID=A0ABD3P837_9STRA
MSPGERKQRLALDMCLSYRAARSGGELMSSRSQGSVSTAPAAGSGTPMRKDKMKSHTNSPPRAAMTNSKKKPPPAAVTSAGRGAAQEGAKDDGAVPHVVRVTFLGVSGLLAKPPHLGGTPPAADAEGGATRAVADEREPSTRRQVTTSPAAAEHPSLLFPLPPHLCVVASVSRSRTARGIPSVVSKCLSRSGNQKIDKNSQRGGGMGYLKPVIEELNISSNRSVMLSMDMSPARRSSLRQDSMSGKTSSVTAGIPGVEVSPLALPKSHGDKSNKLEKQDTGEAIAEEEQPERFVAVWNQGGKQTNALAFEAELRPSSLMVDTLPDEAPTPSASSAFAPKSFVVTLGLVSHFDASPSTDEGQSSAARASMPPTFAIPVAFTDLVVNGDETLDGRRKQIDLPLSSISNLIDAFGDEALGRANYFPLIQLIAEGTVLEVDAKAAASAPENMAVAKIKKAKRNSIVKRMFSRKQHQPSVPTVWESSATQPHAVYSGAPRSIFELDRLPNNKERTLFLDRFGVAGDAVLRIGLEVFPRGSELEKIFRQKNFLRKRALSKSKNKAHVENPDDCSQYSFSTSDSRSHSLMDTLGDSDSDYSDTYSESYFTLDDNTFNSTWDESTMYTDGFSRFSSFNTTPTMDTYLNDDENTSLNSPDSIRSNRPKPPSPVGFLSNLLACNLKASCVGSDNGEIRGMYSNEDVVLEAVAGMEIVKEEDTNASNGKIIAQDDVIRSSSRVESIRSGSSVDTAKRRTAPDQSSSITVEDVVERTTPENSGGSDGVPPPALETALSSVTLANETTPLALILQRVTRSHAPDDDGENEQAQSNEGHEFTLEDHFSGSI